MFTFLGQVLGVSNPAACLTGTGGLIVSKFVVQRFNESDSFTKRLAEKLG